MLMANRLEPVSVKTMNFQGPSIKAFKTVRQWRCPELHRARGSSTYRGRIYGSNRVHLPLRSRRLCIGGWVHIGKFRLSGLDAADRLVGLDRKPRNRLRKRARHPAAAGVLRRSFA